jgi:hypothetical protein
MVSYKLPIVDVAKCARIFFFCELFFALALWYYHFGKSFWWTLSIETWAEPTVSVLSRSRSEKFSPGSRTTLFISTQYFLQRFRRIFITHELWQYNIQQKSYTTLKSIISHPQVLVTVLLKKIFGFGPVLAPVRKKLQSRSRNQNFPAGTWTTFTHLYFNSFYVSLDLKKASW